MTADMPEKSDSASTFFTEWSTKLDNWTLTSVSEAVAQDTPPSSTVKQYPASSVAMNSTVEDATIHQKMQSVFQSITSDAVNHILTENHSHDELKDVLSATGKYSDDFGELKNVTSASGTLSSIELSGDESTSTLALGGILEELSTPGMSHSSEMNVTSRVSPVDVNTGVELSNFSKSTFPSTVIPLEIEGFRTGIPRATQAASTTIYGQDTLPHDITPHSVTDRLSSALSSIFSNVTDSSREVSSSSPVNSTDSGFTNVTLSPFVLCCDFPTNNSASENAESPYPGIYDVILEPFKVGGQENSGAVLTAKAVTLGFLALVGVMGNALVIWSVVRQRHMHRPPFYYLLSLSLTDLSRAAFCLPLVLMTLLQGSVWRHGDSACDLFAFANSFFVLSSSVSLLDIAADRHLSLLYSYSYKRRSAGAVNLVVVLLGWTVAFLVSFPPVVGVGAYAFEASEGQCTLRHKFIRHDNNTLGFLLVFTVLLVATLFIYYRVFLSLRAHRKMRPLEPEPARSANWSFVGPGTGQVYFNWGNGTTGANSGPLLARHHPLRAPYLYTRGVGLHVARNQHVVRLFFLMTLVFTGLWLPYQILSYWRVFGSAKEIAAGLVTAAAWLSYGQVVVCPVVYFSSRPSTRRRTAPRGGDASPEDKQQHEQLLLESLNRQK
ncbi:hypothetical protein ACOMHN_028670 [Nucella lapillus]